MIKSALIPLAMALAAVPAAAAEPGSATVSLSAADFASPLARQNLGHRIRDAIESVCGSYSSAEVRDWGEIDGCWRSARAQVDSKLAAARGGQTIQLTAR